MSLLTVVGAAHASENQAAVFQVPNALFLHPARTLQTLRSMGVGVVRVSVAWNQIAPDPESGRRPVFDASNPAAYPQANWAPYDRIVADASSNGIRVEFLLTGGAPLWATMRGAPSGFESVWRPSAPEYGRFVEAVASRYRTVHTWELWNEPNWGPSLAPQVVRAGSAAIASAGRYRSLLNQGWRALQRAAHRRDTIIAGGLSPDGSATLTPTGTSGPLAFVRTLYCVDRSDRQLRGHAARAVGCPATPAASRNFRRDYLALFRISGFGVHPYSYGSPPTRSAFGSRDTVEFPGIPHLISQLDRLQRTYGSNRRMAIFNTEYGYATRPPQTATVFNTPVSAARLMNWAEYVSWRNPRIHWTAQYELRDAGWFTTGLLFSDGSPKPAFYAYLMPLFLPRNTAVKGQMLKVWGGVRPAAKARHDTHRPQTALIQFRARARGAFRTIKRVRITNRSGYFDLRVRFPGSGAVRVAWDYPPDDQRLANPVLPSRRWIYSRTAYITIR